MAELLFLEYQQEEEGFLSQRRAVIVARRHLNLVGKKIIPKKKIKHKLKHVPVSVFGNVLESIIGAIYIDKGIEDAKRFVKKHVYNSEFLEEFSNIDFKSKLLQYAQKENITVNYKVEKIGGVDHKKEFLVAVFINGKKIAEAKESSIKGAEQKASKKVINKVV